MHCSALLLGDTDPELRDIQDQFRHTGTSHHLSVSGMHVAVLGGFIYLICRLLRLRPRWAVSIGLLFTLLYGIVALPAPPIIRSVLLCWFFGVGILLRRSCDSIQLISLTVLAMLIYHPMDLYNAGFQLGFGTLLALIVFARPFIEFMRRMSGEEPIDPAPQAHIVSARFTARAQRIFDAFCLAILAWAVSMPLVIYHFNQINPWAIVCSIVLPPFVFAALIGGFLKIVLTLLWPSLAGTWAAMATGPVVAMRGCSAGCACPAAISPCRRCRFGCCS